MYGFILNGIRQFVIETFGKDAWEAMMQQPDIRDLFKNGSGLN